MSADIVGLDGITRAAGIPLKDRAIAALLASITSMNEEGRLGAIHVVAWDHNGSAIHSGIIGEDLPTATAAVGGLELAKARVLREAADVANHERVVPPEPEPA